MAGVAVLGDGLDEGPAEPAEGDEVDTRVIG